MVGKTPPQFYNKHWVSPLHLDFPYVIGGGAGTGEQLIKDALSLHTLPGKLKPRLRSL